jgi:putative ABC transport system substrate-binding protein
MSKLLLVAIVLCLGLTAPAAEARFKVMIVTWNGCEEACKGFQTYLQERGLKSTFLVRDADRNKDRLPGFVDEARAEKVDLILTYGTSVTLGIAGRLADAGKPGFAHEIPKVFMIVADPVGVGLIDSLEQTGRPDLTGTYNRLPESVNIETLRAYRPGFRRLGLLYHADERNSIVKRDEVAALTGPMGFDLVALELPLGGDRRPRADDIARRLAEMKAAGVDFLYLGSSSFLRENADVVTGAAIELGIPVLSPYESLVRNSQALVSVAARYSDIGRLAGAQAEKILVGKRSPGELPVARMTSFAVVINMQVARKLKAFPPLELLQVAETVN